MLFVFVFALSLMILIIVVQELVKRYSEFINFPIYLWATKEVDEEVPADEDESSDDEETCMYKKICIHSPVFCTIFFTELKVGYDVNVCMHSSCT